VSASLMPRRVWLRREKGATEDEVIEIEPGALSGLFAAPQWLRDLGFSAWLLFGVGAALVAAIWLLSLTEAIVMPLITAGIIAAVASPLVDWLRRHGVPRGIGAALVLLLIVALALAVGLIVLAGISSEASGLSSRLQEGAGQIESWFRDLGVKAPAAADANSSASASFSGAFQALTHGLVGGIDKLAGLAIFLSFTALSGGGDRRRRAARERSLPATGPADRLRRGAEAAPLAVLIATIAGGCLFGPGTGGAAPLGRGEDLGRPHRGRGERGVGLIPGQAVAIPPSGRSAGR
jgi:AI-2E family transporter